MSPSAMHVRRRARTASVSPLTGNSRSLRAAMTRRRICACHLVGEIADWYGFDQDDVWTCMAEVPPAADAKLDSPEGWAWLATYTAVRLAGEQGAAAPTYAPMVH